MKPSHYLRLLFVVGASSGSWTSIWSDAKELPNRHLRQRETNVDGGSRRELKHHGGGHAHPPETTPVVNHPVTSISEHMLPHGHNEPNGYGQAEGYGDAKSEPYGGSGDHGYHDPYKNPTELPTPYPTPRPTPEPTSYPTYKPTPRPTRRTPAPSPAPSEEPSENPTNSEEPSEQPTNSEEPSEDPTSSEEPSENPTSSEEPSENPTGSEEPTQSSGGTIAAFICAEENQLFLSTLCALIAASPTVFGILNNSLTVDLGELGLVPDFDSSQFLTFVQPRVPAFDSFEGARDPADINGRAGGEDGEDDKRNLARNNRRAEETKLTLFAPDNDAMDRFLKRSLEDLFDLGNEAVVNYFQTSSFDYKETSSMLDFIVSFEGRFVLDEILLTHVMNEERSSNDLICNGLFVMLSMQLTATECIGTVNGFVQSKYQYGEGNDRIRPKITGKDFKASNGIIHIVSEVILPDLNVFVLSSIDVSSPTRSPSTAHAPGSFVLENSALKDSIIYVPKDGDAAERDEEKEGGQ
eukprot:CAMPEP_0197187804 /NCGR_PEP_ID=MMETSP1423-20130617/16592_1 /TAXON_ID=476441 /ORGANISM="Pseudo-nitzschia heimii, Strain UNC1101" /LENGTH=522 /DNA_ID=CAMNT_0042639469 /DNA_START=194 /DNA_END=1762 /DNA_ORIENTATION=+